MDFFKYETIARTARAIRALITFGLATIDPNQWASTHGSRVSSPNRVKRWSVLVLEGYRVDPRQAFSVSKRWQRIGEILRLDVDIVVSMRYDEQEVPKYGPDFV